MKEYEQKFVEFADQLNKIVELAISNYEIREKVIDILQISKKYLMMQQEYSGKMSNIQIPF